MTTNRKYIEHASKRRDNKPGVDGLAPVERRFIRRLIHHDMSAWKAYKASTTGGSGSTWQRGAKDMIARPQVQAAITAEIANLRAHGRIAGIKQLLRLVDTAKSEYVQADVAKYLNGNPDKAQGPATGVTININLGGERMTITADATDPTTDS